MMKYTLSTNSTKPKKSELDSAVENFVAAVDKADESEKKAALESVIAAAVTFLILDGLLIWIARKLGMKLDVIYRQLYQAKNMVGHSKIKMIENPSDTRTYGIGSPYLPNQTEWDGAIRAMTKSVEKLLNDKNTNIDDINDIVKGTIYDNNGSFNTKVTFGNTDWLHSVDIRDNGWDKVSKLVKGIDQSLNLIKLLQQLDAKLKMYKKAGDIDKRYVSVVSTVTRSAAYLCKGMYIAIANAYYVLDRDIYDNMF